MFYCAHFTEVETEVSTGYDLPQVPVNSSRAVSQHKNYKACVLILYRIMSSPYFILPVYP